MKKVASYTLLELIVVFAISGIVILNIIGLYLYVQKQFQRYKKQIDSEIEIVQFMSSLTNDINLGNPIKSGTNKIIIERTSGKQVLYKFLDAQIIRTAEKVDTFSISIKKLDILSNEEQKLISRINLDITKGGKVSSFSLIKNYDNATIVNQEIKQSKYGD